MFVIFRFPKENTRRQLWIKAVRRKDWEPTQYSRICSEHFRDIDMDRTSLSCVRVRDDAVPCIFSSFPSYMQKVSYLVSVFSVSGIYLFARMWC